MKHREFFIGLILTLSLLWPLFAGSYFSHHDDVQVIRIYEMNKCIKDNQIPCRWVPDLGGLYGYPIFNYYAPLPYYFGELIFLLSKNLIFSAKVMFAISFIGSYIFMYLLASKFWGKIGGALSAIFYSFAPYHAVDFYVRGAIGEMWGLMLFPAVFWALIKLEEKTNIGNLTLLSIFIFALLASHNLSAMIFLPVLALGLVPLYLKRRNQRFLYFSFGSIFLGILLASFYLLPMLTEKNLVHVETTTFGYFSYTEHFKGIKKLFLERDWGWGSSIREVPGGEKDGLSFQIGWIHLLGWMLALFSAKVLWKSNKWLSGVIIFSSVAALVSIFMVHPRSEPIWKLFESLKYLQFPWRYLLMVIFFLSFISGSIVLISKQKKQMLFITLTIAVVLFNFSYFRPERFLNVDDQALLSGQNWDRQIKRSIFDYLPIFAKEPPAELATARYQILTGETKVSDFKEGSNWFKFKAKADSHSIIRISQYYFPEWKIFVDGKEINFTYTDNSLGLMTFILGRGEHNIEGRLYDTPIRSLANRLTILGFGILALLFVLQFKVVKTWILYYKERVS